jgi:putative Mn2+ efflux pump MntP
MSDAHHPAPKSGGGLGKAFGGVLLLLIVVFSGLISAFTDQIGHFLQTLTYQVGYVFQVMKMNAGPILAIVGAVLIFRSMKK